MSEEAKLSMSQSRSTNARFVEINNNCIVDVNQIVAVNPHGCNNVRYLTIFFKIRRTDCLV